MRIKPNTDSEIITKHVATILLLKYSYVVVVVYNDQ